MCDYLIEPPRPDEDKCGKSIFCKKCGREADKMYQTSEGLLCDCCTKEYILEAVKEDPLSDNILKALGIKLFSLYF